MLELERKEKYDPRIYGELKADFLNKLDPISYIAIEEMPDQEKKRQELLKDIMEGKFTIKQ